MGKYRLVVTQWSLNPGLPSPFDPDFTPAMYQNTLAGDPCPQSAANVTMETYYQTSSSWIIYDRVINLH